MIILIICDGNLKSVGWNLPIQAVNGYDNISFAVPGLQYVLHCSLYKIFYLAMTLSIILLISSWSKNNGISAVFSLVFVGALLIAYKMNQNGLWIGCMKSLLCDLAFVQVGEIVFPKYICAYFIMIMVCLISTIVTVKSVCISSKRWAR